MKNGDYTILWGGKIYRFPTEKEMDEWLAEQEGEEDDD